VRSEDERSGRIHVVIRFPRRAPQLFPVLQIETDEFFSLEDDHGRSAIQRRDHGRGVSRLLAPALPDDVSVRLVEGHGGTPVPAYVADQEIAGNRRRTRVAPGGPLSAEFPLVMLVPDLRAGGG